MSNAAIYFHPDGYDTSRASLLGRHSAGESFLRGFLRHADVDPVTFFTAPEVSAERGDALVRRIELTERRRAWISSRAQLRDVGVLNLPVPGLDEEAWLRLPTGEQAYSLCGITHTTATVAVMRALADFFLAPLHDYDALICTSSAVRDAVEAELDGVREYMEAEYGPRRGHTEPQRVTIPLGINVADFATSAEQRAAWRERLEIPDDGVVALYVGRFDASAKMNPALMALALEQAARQTDKRLYWVNSGWLKAGVKEEEFHASIAKLCPSVRYLHVDGRPVETRFSIWSVADFFISFSDNVQETFGLTPVEAMAAGLPCVVTDWNGYKDTVRDGEDGFRIPTYAPAPGAGRDLAYAFLARWLSYDGYVGATGQYTAVDYGAAARAIVALAENPDLRRRLGAQAQARARAVFDWAAVIPQYQALWAEQNARRAAAPPPPTPRRLENPFRPDPFRLFAGYPSRHLARDWRLEPAPGVTWADAETVLRSPLASYGNYARPTLNEARQVFEWVAEHPGRSVGELIDLVAAARRPFIERGLLWIARFGAIVLSPPA